MTRERTDLPLVAPRFMHNNPNGAREVYRMLCTLLPPFYSMYVQKKYGEDQDQVILDDERYLMSQEHHMWLLVQKMCEMVGSHFYEIAQAAAFTAKCIQDTKNMEKNPEKFTYKTLYSMSSEDYDKIAEEMHKIANNEI